MEREFTTSFGREPISIRTGKLEVEEEVFVFPDRHNGKVHVYDSKGNRILTRRMNADEAQLEIK